MPKPECPLCDLTNCFHSPKNHISNNFIDLYFNYTTDKITNRYVIEIYNDKITILSVKSDTYQVLTSLENIFTKDKSNNLKILNKTIENLLFI